jgi:NAD(P)H-dependent flavin oxidoreductase YrpB (nitropropane dioxygenase family)
MMDIGALRMAQQDGGAPTTLAAGSAPGESGVSVLNFSFDGGMHLLATPRCHCICFEMSQVRVEKRMAGRIAHYERPATDAPFNINFITCFDNDAQIRVCAEEKVPVASFHWGHPAAEHLTLLRDAGVSVWEQIGNVEAARRAVGDGVEVIVAQGWEAGGHNYGGLPTIVLVPEILDGVSPALVLASGGIVDGRSVAAALALGADGVWVGTRLIATPEAAVHYEHKRRLVEGTGEQTVRSSIFGPEWPHFNPMRLLRNRVVDEWTDRLAEVPTVRDSLPVIGRTIFLGQATEMRKFNVLLPSADTDGDWEEMPWLAGQGVGLIHDIRPAKDVVETMMADAKAILKRLSGSL